MSDAIDEIDVLHAWIGNWSPDMIAISDVSGRIHYLNPSGFALLG